jgi:hypothetical protein
MGAPYVLPIGLEPMVSQIISSVKLFFHDFADFVTNSQKCPKITGKCPKNAHFQVRLPALAA